MARLHHQHTEDRLAVGQGQQALGRGRQGVGAEPHRTAMLQTPLGHRQIHLAVILVGRHHLQMLLLIG